MSPPLLVWGRALSPVQVERSSTAKLGPHVAGEGARATLTLTAGARLRGISQTLHVDSLFASWVKMNEFTVKNGIHWNHIPSVVRRYEGGDEVDFVARIGYPSAQRAAGNGDRVRIAVISSAVGENRFDLNAQEPLPALHHEVVGQTVAVRLRNCDAERGGFEKEGQFGQFAVDLGGVTCTSPSLAAD